MTNMEWYVNNGSKLMRPHYMGSVRSHTCTTSFAYHSFFFFFSKNRLSKILFFKTFPQKSSDCESQKSGFAFDPKNPPWVWILWIHDPDLDFPKKNTPSASSSGPSQLGETTGVQIYFLKGDIKKNTYKSDIQLTSMEIFGKSKLNELAIFYYL